MSKYVLMISYGYLEVIYWFGWFLCVLELWIDKLTNFPLVLNFFGSSFCVLKAFHNFLTPYRLLVVLYLKNNSLYSRLNSGI